MNTAQALLTGALFLALALPARGEWWIVYSPVVAKHSGRATYCCFPTRSACEAARTRYLRPGDSVGCQGVDAPAKKGKAVTQGQTTESQGAGEEAARKARAAEQRRDEEARFRQDKSEMLDSLKGLDDSGVEGPAGPAVEQLKNDAAWSGSAAGSRSEEKAREEAEHGAQGRGGIKHLPVGKIPEVPAPERVPE